MKKNRGRVIGQYDVVELIGTAFTKASTMNVVVNKFKNKRGFDLSIDLYANIRILNHRMLQENSC